MSLPDDMPKMLGRYELHQPLASGGMATVHLGRLVGEVGFTRAVAVKRLHPIHARDEAFVRMFLDEARLAARVRHPNVVATLDVLAAEGELFVVMDYVHGESVSRLLKILRARAERMPVAVVGAIMTDVLEGLHAAHEAKSERGDSLGIVHRDVSPQNVLVGMDGVARVLDFGIARATEKMHSPDDGPPRGKLPYMAPEQLRNEAVDRRADLWAAAVVCWEMLVGRRLFDAVSSDEIATRIVEGPLPWPGDCGAPGELDIVLQKALARDREKRFASAREMAAALEAASAIASKRAVSDWLERIIGDALRERASGVEKMERNASIFRPSGATKIELAGLRTKRDSDMRPHGSAVDANAGIATAEVVTAVSDAERAREQTKTLPVAASVVPPIARRGVRSPKALAAVVLAGAALSVVALAARRSRERELPAAFDAIATAEPPSLDAQAVAEPAPAPEPSRERSEGAAEAGAQRRKPRPRATASVVPAAPTSSAPQSKYGREPW